MGGKNLDIHLRGGACSFLEGCGVEMCTVILWMVVVSQTCVLVVLLVLSTGFATASRVLCGVAAFFLFSHFVLHLFV